VSWFGNDLYYGWSPLSWWNRPIVIINNHWDRRYDYRRGIPHHSRSTIIIRKNELSAANIHRVALNRSTLGQNASGTISYRGAAPTDRPALNKVTVINAKGKTVSYKQGGIVSAEKYRAQGSDLHSTVYKYNQANSGAITYRKKSTGSSAEEGSGSVIRSRSGEGSGSVNRVRYTPSGSSSGKSTGKTSYRSKSDGAAKTSTSSSSTSSSSSGTVKKKKGGTSYFSSTSGENSAGKAVTSDTRSQSRYSSPSYNYRSNRETGNNSANGAYSPSTYGKSSYRSTTPATFTSRGYGNNSSSGTSTRSAGSRSSGSSAVRPQTAHRPSRRPWSGTSARSRSTCVRMARISTMTGATPTSR